MENYQAFLYRFGPMSHICSNCRRCGIEYGAGQSETLGIDFGEAPVAPKLWDICEARTMPPKEGGLLYSVQQDERSPCLTIARIFL